MGLFSRDFQFKSNGDIYGKIRAIIVESHDFLDIVSPYIAPSDDFLREVEAAARRNVEVRVIFRRDKLGEYRTSHWLPRLEQAGVVLLTVERLHSKLYVNEEDSLVTSMNFATTSGENSFEAGMWGETASSTGDEIAAYIKDLVEHHAQPASAGGRTAPTRERRPRTPRSNAARPAQTAGFCIRCATSLPLNPARPYCPGDFEKWSQFQNPDYQDKFCHGCGRPHPATMKRPLCLDCFKATSGR